MLPTRGDSYEFRFAVNAIRGDMLESDFMAIDQINEGHSDRCNFIPEAAEPEPTPCKVDFDPAQVQLIRLFHRVRVHIPREHVRVED